MCIVPAGVHHVHILAFIVFRDGLAAVRQASVFCHRQCIHIRSHKHSWPVAILHDAHHAVTFEFGVLIFA